MDTNRKMYYSFTIHSVVSIQWVIGITTIKNYTNTVLSWIITTILNRNEKFLNPFSNSPYCLPYNVLQCITMLV